MSDSQFFLSSPGKEITSLTAARGIAALVVVLYHIRIIIPDSANIFEKGYLAVDFFFILSGFVMMTVYGRLNWARGTGVFGAFVRNRALRLLPLHLTVLFTMAAFATSLEVMDRPNPERYPWSELPAQLLLVHGWGFGTKLYWNDPSWSISTEIAAYGVFAFMLMTGVQNHLNRWLSLIAAFGCLVSVAVGFPLMGLEDLDQTTGSAAVLRCFSGFFLGALTASSFAQGRGSAFGASIAAYTVIATMASLGLGWPAETTLIMPLFTIIILLIIKVDSIAFFKSACRIIRPLGIISYSIYLNHFFIWIIYKIVFIRDLGDSSFFHLVSYLFILISLSMMSYNLVEVKMRRWIERRFGWHKQSTTLDNVSRCTGARP